MSLDDKTIALAFPFLNENGIEFELDAVNLLRLPSSQSKDVILSDIYYAMTTKGEEISLPKTNLTAWDIEKIINDKRGGKRAGAGPKLKTGYVTTTLRIPSTLKESFKCYIDMYTQYYKGDEENIPYFTNEEDRLNTIRDMMSVLKYEEHLIYERRRRAAEEEENKRQRKLFGDENQ